MTTNDKTIVGKDHFLAKKSGSYTTDISSDRDVWCEYLAVVEIAVPENKGTKNKERYELHIKSFFESALTGKRSWDEPPSGATTIQYASDEDRRRAEEERATLQTTTRSYGCNDAQKETSRKFSRFNVFKRWRRRKKGDASEGGMSSITDSNEMAIEHSFGAGTTCDLRNVYVTEQTFTHNSEPKVNGREISEVKQQLNLEEQDAIAMAQALSLSERDIAKAEERKLLIQNVLYESKTGAYSGGTGLAYGNIPLENLEENHELKNNDEKGRIGDEIDGDLKMRAI